MKGRAPTTLEDLSQRVTDPSTNLTRDTDEIYVRLEDAQDDSALQRGTSQHIAMDCNRAVHAKLQAYQDQVQTYETHIQTWDAHIGSLETLVATLVAQTSYLVWHENAAKKNCRNHYQGVAHALAEIKANKTSRNGDDGHDSGTGSRRTKRDARECTYTNFLKRQPPNFKGTKGVVGLTQWFEKMEFAFHISNCTIACQIKFATCTLQRNSLTWWNSHVRTVGHDVAYAMTWKTSKKMMTNKYCLRGEIKKLGIKLWNLKVKEYDEVEKYVGGLPDMIQGSVMVYKPKKMQDAIKFVTELMDQKINTLAELPRAQGANQRVITCIECGGHGHFKSNCSNLKNKNQGNRAGNGNAVARAYAVGTAGITPNSNVVTGTFLLHNRYTLILFDTSANRSFVSTAFSSLIDIIPTILDHGYDVELADGKIIWVTTLLQCCTLNFLNHLFNIDLMPVEIGSFDVIIGMDWLSKYHVVIFCDEKIVRIPFGDEILIVHGDGSNNEHGSRLNIISCTKTQKYLLKGCHVLLVHVTAKKAKD
ncbi:putative reverse transcriptase domain-containing protein [Tanacetum coccineum]